MCPRLFFVPKNRFIFSAAASSPLSKIFYFFLSKLHGAFDKLSYILRTGHAKREGGRSRETPRPFFLAFTFFFNFVLPD